MAQQPQGGQGGKGGSGNRQDPATDPAQRPDPDAANTDETVQAEERAAGGASGDTSGGTSGSGNTLGDGMTAGGAQNVQERKVLQQDEGGQDDNKENKGLQGPVKIAVAGDEHGDEDATSQ